MANLLIIDDDKFFLNSASYILKSEGFEIDVIQDGKQGLELSNNKFYDLVICGTQLQHKSGYEVATQIKNHSPNTQIILVSPANNIVSVSVTDDLVYDAYFQKPINFLDLKTTIARLLSTEKV